MADFLLELLSEEVPARMQARAADELRSRIEAGLQAAGSSRVMIKTAVNPRRLSTIVTGLPGIFAGSTEERRGPRADAPAQAIAGFARGAGVAVEALQPRDDPKGRFLYAVMDRPGRGAADVLADVIGEALTGFPWPKSMRWGAASVSMDSPRWVRPLVGAVALLDGAVVPLSILGVAAGRETVGHRFLSRGAISIASAGSYAAQLRDAHVIVDAQERMAIIRDGARAAAAAAGLVLIEDEGLVAENAGLTEWPVPLLGRFDEVYLELPREVIQLTMRTNQKYFACANADGALAAAFVCVANIPGADGGAAIVEGNRRVLAARLSDARFFWEQDLAEWRREGDIWDRIAPKLERVVFHEKLGSMRDKAERVARLARWLVTSGAVTPGLSRGQASPSGADSSWVPAQGRDDDGAVEALADMAHRAGLLAKADLVSAMVGEFPELQGVMGGYYALASGEDPAVAAAVRDHYRPSGPGDTVPTKPVSVAVALADKLDTLVGFFGIGEAPTGSRDPFALRRAGLGIIAIIYASNSRFSIVEVLVIASLLARYGIAGLDDPSKAMMDDVWTSSQPVAEFIVARVNYQQKSDGLTDDLIRAVFSLGEADLVRLLARCRALQAFVGTEDGANLLAGYKRAANILAIEAKKDGVARFEGNAPSLSLAAAPPVPLPREAGEGNATVGSEGEGGAEAALAAILEPAAAEAANAVAREDFTAAMAALARLRGPIDAFFEDVMVNDPDPRVRLARLSLLQRFHDAVQQVADFSKIEG